MSRLVVLVGSSGVGKSTLARALQEELLPEQWLHFSVDTIFYCLPQSVTLRVDQDNDRSLINPGSVVASALACTRTLLGEGHKVIYDAVVASNKGASRLLCAFEGHDPIVVELTCAWKEIERRTRERGDRTLEEAELGFRSARGHLAAHHSFDTTETKPEEIARRLAAAMRAKPE
jgi:chloramphenicol 3-O phosphotransferase